MEDRLAALCPLAGCHAAPGHPQADPPGHPPGPARRIRRGLRGEPAGAGAAHEAVTYPVDGIADGSDARSRRAADLRQRRPGWPAARCAADLRVTDRHPELGLRCPRSLHTSRRPSPGGSHRWQRYCRCRCSGRIRHHRPRRAPTPSACPTARLSGRSRVPLTESGSSCSRGSTGTRPSASGSTSATRRWPPSSGRACRRAAPPRGAARDLAHR
jgi:hypothetical protein